MAATAITSLRVSNITTDNTTGTLDDENADNSALNAYYVYVTGAKVSYDATETSLTITSDSPGYDNNYFDQLTSATDSTFDFNIPEDGWFKFKYVAAPEWDVSTSFSQYDISVDAGNGRFYQANKSVTGGSTPSVNTADWDLVPSPDSLLDYVSTASDPGNIYYQEFDTILKPNTSKALGTQTVNSSLECCTDCKREEDVELYELFTLFVKGMTIADSRNQYVKGEKIARRAEQLI